MKLWLLLVALTVFRLAIAACIPLAPDEAYYWVWSHALAPGYPDHPPMVALWIRLGTMLAGPWRAAVALRREVAPILNQRQGIAWGAVGIVYLLLVLWGPTHALRTWWGILLVGGLIAAGVYVLRRQTLLEFPGYTADNMSKMRETYQALNIPRDNLRHGWVARG